MNKKRIYISAPMKGRSVEEYTKDFRDAREFLEELGYEAVTPLDNGLPTDFPVEDHMRRDYKLILDCQAIYLCKGWERSHGCMNELQVASDCGLTVITTNSYKEYLDAYEEGQIIKAILQL